MCNRIVRFIASISLGIACLVSSEGGTSDSLPKMIDPLFGISYDSHAIRFETASERIAKVCRNLNNRKLWIFARWKGPEIEYLVLSGYVPSGHDTKERKSRRMEPDVAGVVVAVSDSACVSGIPDIALRGESVQTKRVKSVELNQAVIDELSSDAIRRYVKAFGGRERFLATLRETRGLDSSALPLALQAQLQILRGKQMGD